MTTPSIVPSKYLGTDADYYQAPGLNSGALKLVTGSVTIPSGTAATTVVGLIPFRKGASFDLDNNSIYCADFGAGTTTVDIGYVYDDNSTYTNDDDAWASADTAPQSGGFVAIDLLPGMTFVSEADGWLAVTINTAAADAEADITFKVGVSYGA